MTRLTDEDKKLWREVAKSATPLRLRVDPLDVAAPEAPPVKVKTPPPPPPQKPEKKTLFSKKLTPHPKEPPSREVDTRTLARFKRGQMAIDGTLDLHGYKLSDAEIEIASFLRFKHNQGARCLLIIHGKGLLTGTAKIKKALPGWLAGFPDIVLSHAIAQPKHGGHGASYVLLRRKRVTNKP